jgi:hypothetical protein
MKCLFNECLGEQVFLHEIKVLTKWGYAKLHQDTVHLVRLNTVKPRFTFFKGLLGTDVNQGIMNVTA